jgi:hypothetical protein
MSGKSGTSLEDSIGPMDLNSSSLKRLIKVEDMISSKSSDCWII